MLVELLLVEFMLALSMLAQARVEATAAQIHLAYPLPLVLPPSPSLPLAFPTSPLFPSVLGCHCQA